MPNPGYTESASTARVPLLDLSRGHAELASELRAAIDRVVRSGRFIDGEEVEAFEREFAAYCGTAHCVGVANGTDALVLALRALGVGPGDAVLTVPFSFIATLEAIDLVGATPVLVDIDPTTFTIDAQQAVAAMARRSIKAVLAVHLYGHPADMEPLLSAAREHGAAVVEDAAQAHGARLRLGGTWRRAGALGRAACFSFYPTKNLGAMGDAGAVTTGDAELAARLRLLRDHGQAGKYAHVARGATNSRLDALQAAVLGVKLRALDRWNAARRAAVATYETLLADCGAALPRERQGAESVFHQYAVRVPERNAVQQRLLQRGIQTAVHYPVPLHLQEAYSALGFSRGSFPEAERAADTVLSLPMSAHLTGEEQRRVAVALREVLIAERPRARCRR
jgi:dTDP-4-amino-4,6-dideoxygalactose transaminase